MVKQRAGRAVIGGKLKKIMLDEDTNLVFSFSKYPGINSTNNSPKSLENIEAIILEREEYDDRELIEKLNKLHGKEYIYQGIRNPNSYY
jgi:hypothetical protein